MRDQADELLLLLVDYAINDQATPQEVAEAIVLLKVKSEFLRRRARRKKPAAVTLERGEVVDDG